jgi:hypothetical protein
MPTAITIDGESMRIGIPPSWRKVQDGAATLFGPESGLGQVSGKTKIVYGVEIGVAPVAHGDPNGVLDDMVDVFKNANPGLRSASITRLVRLAGRLGLRGTFANASLVNGNAEFVVIAAAPLSRGRALYVIGIAPERQWSGYRPTFEAVLTSIEKTP